MSEQPYAELLRSIRGESGVITGDSLDELQRLPAECVHTCVTSPPYWGLRDYGTRRWFDGDPTCEHDRAVAHGPHHPGQVPQTNPRRDVPSATLEGEMVLTEQNRTEAVSEGQRATTASCSKCGAWWGQLGLEPTPELYVEHMVQLFRGVRRVLRDDGTLWLNIGDTYSVGYTHGKQGNSSTVAVRSHQGTSIARRKLSGDLKPKDLVGIPWMVAFALRADGWYLRSEIIWHKPNVMPESVEDRPTRCHEQLFLLSKSRHYFYDVDAIREPHNLDYVQRRLTFDNTRSENFRPDRRPDMSLRYDGVPMGNPLGRNKRDVWTINPRPYRGAHFATFPPELPETCIRAGTSEKGCCPACGAPWRRTKTAWEPTCACGLQETIPCVVLEPFTGSGTTLAAAAGLRRSWLGIEINPDYRKLIAERLDNGRINSPTASAEARDLVDMFMELPNE